MIRLHLLLSFLDELGDYRKHTIRELSQTLEVSERTIKRYKALALDHGFEIDSKAGRYGYYQLISMQEYFKRYKSTNLK